MQYYGQQKRNLLCNIAAKETFKAILRVLPCTNFQICFSSLDENTSLRGPVKRAKCTDFVVKCTDFL